MAHKLTNTEKTKILRALLKDLKLAVMDKPTTVLPKNGYIYDNRSPYEFSLAGSVGPAKDPDFTGPTPPSSMGLVFLASPDETKGVEVTVSGKFDLVFRSMPTIENQVKDLVKSGEKLKQTQEVSKAYTRFTVEFKNTRFNFPIEDCKKPSFDYRLPSDNIFNESILDLAERLKKIPEIFCKCKLDAKGKPPFVIPWNDSITSQQTLNEHIKIHLLDQADEIMPYNVRLRSRLRAAPKNLRKHAHTVLIEIFFENDTTYSDAFEHGLEQPHILDVSFSATLTEGKHHSMPHKMQPEDFRYYDSQSVPGYGITCGVVEIDNGVATESMPSVEMQLIETPTPLDCGMELGPKYDLLAQDPFPVLEDFLAALGRYKEVWVKRENTFRKEEKIEEAKSVAMDANLFSIELVNIQDGVRLLKQHSKLEQAFKLMNEAMRKAIIQQGKSFNEWRLFQLGFILTQVRSIWERFEEGIVPEENSYETADVLKFDTGGGKTEAYLGIILMQLFYQRTMNRTYGTSAWMRFPLRMLSVQQFQRLSYVIAQANLIRQREKMGGFPFTIGYFTGGGTPKYITRYFDNDREYYLPDLTVEKLQSLKFISDCPYCIAVDSVVVKRDLEKGRILHTCTNPQCASNIELDGQEAGSIRGELGIYISDEECYRYLPTVLVGTIDKLAVIAWNAKFSHFYGTEPFYCPEHGFISESTCKQKRIKLSPDKNKYEDAKCGNTKTKSSMPGQKNQTIPVPKMKDPGFPLMIQDELHLLQENLGNFDGHYESLVSTIQVAYGGKPPKIIAATATIKEFEHQIHHLYQRHARRFPMPGASIGESFYTRRVVENGKPVTRRIYAAILPLAKGNDKSSLAVAELNARYLDIIENKIAELKDNPNSGCDALGISREKAELIHDHIAVNLDTTLMYVNNKNAIDKITDYLEKAESFSKLRQGREVEILRGETELSKIQQIIERIGSKEPGDPLRQLIATSVISHGVDIERLNCIFLSGWPSLMAEYVQASARSGRVHPGLVITALSHIKVYERNVFMNFTDYHEFMEKLVESVPINRFAPNVVMRTLPGIMSAIILNWARHQSWCGNVTYMKVQPLHDTLNKNDKAISLIKEQILFSLKASHTPAFRYFHVSVVKRFEKDLEYLVVRALEKIKNMHSGQLDKDLPETITIAAKQRPMRSFRDIDKQMAVKFDDSDMENLADALARR